MKAIWFKLGKPYKSVMLWAASTTNFFSFFRAGEITIPTENAYSPESHLSFKDLRADHPTNLKSISLHIKHSKTDQNCLGVTVVIGRSDDHLCPVSALLSYSALQGNSPGPLFQWENGSQAQVCK